MTKYDEKGGIFSHCVYLYLIFLELEGPLEWPDIGICVSPFYKDRKIYWDFINKNMAGNFKDEEEYKNLKHEVYYDQIDDIIKGAYFSNSSVLEQLVKLNITEPLVKVVQMDYKR